MGNLLPTLKGEVIVELSKTHDHYQIHDFGFEEIIVRKGNKKEKQKRHLGCLYYFFGNFFSPVKLDIGRSGIRDFKIAQFAKANGDLIKRDREDPRYKTLVELMEMEPHDGSVYHTGMPVVTPL